MLSKKIHPLLQNTIQLLKDGATEGGSTINLYGEGIVPISISVQKIHRLIDILTAYSLGLEENNILLVVQNKRIGFVAADQRFCAFRFREKYHQIYKKRKASAKDIAPAHYDQYKRRFTSSLQHGMAHSFNGKFELIYDDCSSFMIRRWEDTSKHSIEDLMNAIIQDIVGVKEKDDQSKLRAEQHRQEKIEFYRPFVAGKLQRAQLDERQKYLRNLMSHYERLSQLNGWLAKVKGDASNDLMLWPQFLAWVQEEIAKEEDLISPAAIEAELQGNKLFDPITASNLTVKAIEEAMREVLDYDFYSDNKEDWMNELLEAIKDGWVRPSWRL